MADFHNIVQAGVHWNSCRGADYVAGLMVLARWMECFAAVLAAQFVQSRILFLWSRYYSKIMLIS